MYFFVKYTQGSGVNPLWSLVRINCKDGLLKSLGVHRKGESNNNIKMHRKLLWIQLPVVFCLDYCYKGVTKQNRNP